MAFGSDIVPNIDWDIDVQVDASSDPLNPKVRAIGSSDLYPAYEVIAENSKQEFKEVYFYEPASNLTPGPFTLGKPQKNSINTNDITLD